MRHTGGVQAASVNARAQALGAFLRSRRERIPVPADGQRRRTPGMRREEVATHARVSLAYYTRLEQGRGHQPSASVLDAIAQALGLVSAERNHLHALASDHNTDLVAARETLHPATATVLDLLPAHAGAYVINRVSDIVACNAVAGALFVDLLDMPSRTRPATCSPSPPLANCSSTGTTSPRTRQRIYALRSATTPTIRASPPWCSTSALPARSSPPSGTAATCDPSTAA